MKPEGRLSGQVSSPHGQPGKDIEVSARIISNGNRDVAFETTFRTVTDDGGEYNKELGIARGQPDLENVDFTIPRKQEANAEEGSPNVSTADEGSQLLRDTGEFDEFLKWLGRWISTPIVDEAATSWRRKSLS